MSTPNSLSSESPMLTSSNATTYRLACWPSDRSSTPSSSSDASVRRSSFR